MKRNSIKVLLLVLLIQASGCESLLDETVYSELTPGNFLNTPTGKQAVLTSAYGNIQMRGHNYLFLSAHTSQEVWNQGGSIEALLTPLTNFTWDSNHQYFSDAWGSQYGAVRDANIVIDNTSSTDATAFDKQLNAEARFVRVVAYNQLYDWFGPVPLYLTSTPSEFKLSRATDAEMKAFIEKELLEVAAELPLSQAQYGRATKGAALGILAKFYLNTKQWQKTADITKQIMDLKKYSLIPNYKNVFAIANEGNAEMLWVIPASAQAGHNLVALTFPTDYPLPQPNQQVFAARSYFFDSFVNSFEPGDTRRDLIITEYTSTSGKFIKLLGINQSLSGKYEFDPNAAGAVQGNDIPVVRYADILLARAEALNELNGPAQEAIDLINQVRSRAGAAPIQVGNFTKETLRDRILQEREWEFYTEMKRREDLIRHGKLISNATAKGKKAQPFHVLFPLPITELNANANLEQNEGY
ncbi:RagB/SusD family nutrient uptake outer membrane protein [Arundinibacter roseus]|uniref:RagB/SusD family nutrient uptake outer membrane protein n=1 Tax=Arundinibacter roseus TaxID=2070510 RepID=A0A4R4KH01_9BACT|nr:RagB/SusD family nutrient uptake outer membrane protein [Arundinibacter roseus]TDB67327.1 RagB/SusD family nutrient uptake outer membrane protein [Arundinibacter roseus]